MPQRALDHAELREAIFSIPYERMPYDSYWERLEEAYRVGRLPTKAAREARLAEIRSVRLITLNYCPMGCTFCSSTNFLHEAQGSVAPIARLDADECLRMIERIVAAHPRVRTIIFQDDIFVFTQDRRILPLVRGDRRRQGARCAAVARCSSSAPTASMPCRAERLAAMRRAGFRVLGFGIESFSQRHAARVQQGADSSRTSSRCSPAALEHGITPFLDLILSSPRATLEDVAATLREVHRWLRRAARSGMYPYVIPFSGAAMAADPTLAPYTVHERREVRGTGIVWQQPAKILPIDPQVCATILRNRARLRGTPGGPATAQWPTCPRACARCYGFSHPFRRWPSTDCRWRMRRKCGVSSRRGCRSPARQIAPRGGDRMRARADLDTAGAAGGVRTAGRWIVLSAANIEAASFSTTAVWPRQPDRLYRRARLPAAPATCAAATPARCGRDRGRSRRVHRSRRPRCRRGHAAHGADPPYAIIASVLQPRRSAGGVHRCLRTLPRAHLADQRRLDRQHGAAAAPGGLAMYSMTASTAASPAHLRGCSSGCRNTSRQWWWSIPTSASARTARAVRHRLEEVDQGLPAIGRRRGVSARHDRARRVSGALPGFRVCACLPRRPREPGRLQHHLRSLYLPARRAAGAPCSEHSLSVYAEDFENAIMLLSQGERIYYDGRLVVSTEGPGTLGRWFSQRVGWYHGLLKVYTERAGAIWRISKRTPFAMYHYRDLHGRPVALAAPGQDRQRGCCSLPASSEASTTCS